MRRPWPTSFVLARRARTVLAGACLASLVSGCGAPIVIVELDRMTGTEFPPSNVVVENKDVSIDSIFEAADIEVGVLEDETAIPRLSDECLLESEISALAAAHQPSADNLPSETCLSEGDCLFYYAHGLIVDHTYGMLSTGLRICGNTRGMMYDTNRRETFVLFFPVLKDDPPELYLRTTAHELAHTFNLHHEDQAGVLTPSIMTQTGELGSSPLPSAWAFGTQEMEDLRHPQGCVLPGTGSFYSVFALHAEHSYVAQDCVK